MEEAAGQLVRLKEIKENAWKWKGNIGKSNDQCQEEKEGNQT